MLENGLVAEKTSQTWRKILTARRHEQRGEPATAKTRRTEERRQPSNDFVETVAPPGLGSGVQRERLPRGDNESSSELTQQGSWCFPRGQGFSSENGNAHISTEKRDRACECGRV